MKAFWIRLMSVAAVVAILFGYNQVILAREAQETAARSEYEELLAAYQEAAQTTASAAYEDGVYTGSGQGFGGTISVEVTISDGEISAIEIISASGEDGAYLSMAEDIIDDILEAQSADVETISGATFSSTGIRTAVAEALEEAAADA